jgi:hypothetical protein
VRLRLNCALSGGHGRIGRPSAHQQRAAGWGFGTLNLFAPNLRPRIHSGLGDTSATEVGCHYSTMTMSVALRPKVSG